jgi:hypothetical protein
LLSIGDMVTTTKTYALAIARIVSGEPDSF